MTKSLIEHVPGEPNKFRLSAPAKGTKHIATITFDRVSALENVARLAGMIVLETPPAKGPWQPTAYVRRDIIRDLEAALVLAGYDMKAAFERMKAAK